MLVFRMSWAGSVEFAEAAVFWPATEPDLVSTEPQSGELVMYFWDSQRMTNPARSQSKLWLTLPNSEKTHFDVGEAKRLDVLPRILARCHSICTVCSDRSGCCSRLADFETEEWMPWPARRECRSIAMAIEMTTG